MNSLVRSALISFALSVSLLGHADEHARWPIKTSVPDMSHKPKAIAFEDLAKLGLPPNPHRSSEHGDSTYQTARYPSFPNALGLREGNLISIRGYLPRRR